MQTMMIFPVKVSIFCYYAMMDNQPAKKCRKSPKNCHIRPPFSLFYLRKCLNNSGRYILVLSQGTEENSNASCSLITVDIKGSLGDCIFNTRLIQAEKTFIILCDRMLTAHLLRYYLG